MTFETFEQFWKENYEKEYGPDTEPFYGIASYAWEMGQRSTEEFSESLKIIKSLMNALDDISRVEDVNLGMWEGDWNKAKRFLLENGVRERYCYDCRGWCLSCENMSNYKT